MSSCISFEITKKVYQCFLAKIVCSYGQLVLISELVKKDPEGNILFDYFSCGKKKENNKQFQVKHGLLEKE